MVMTILEAHVAPEKWAALEQAFATGTEHIPPQLVQTFLIRSAADSTLWRIVSVWHSREALEEMRRSTETPGGVLMFRAASAEPKLSIFDVAAHLAGSAH
jgi:quinol monooxygenase YgiN